jgi:hypothetical protein
MTSGTQNHFSLKKLTHREGLRITDNVIKTCDEENNTRTSKFQLKNVTNTVTIAGF